MRMLPIARWSLFLFLISVDAAPTNVSYTLLHDSYILDECLICGRPSIPRPIRGHFEIHTTPETNHFLLKNIVWTNDMYSVTGEGEIQIDPSKPAQDVTLQIHVITQFTNEFLVFTNKENKDLIRTFPMVNFTVKEDPGTLVRTYTLGISAAPFREILFSTGIQFTSANRPAQSNIIASGDILTSSGEVFESAAQLASQLALEDPFADLATDAYDLSSGGEALFSIGQDLNSTRLGHLGHGDILSDKGRLVVSNSQIFSQFGIQPGPITDYGLDALQQMAPDEYWFSMTADNLFSETIGAQLFRGDVLSSKGRIIKTGQQLVSAFQPAVLRDYGLDALYVWPSGEIWFSTEEGFDTPLGPIGHGDILSDQGYIVFQNLELLNPFAPIEDVSTFGLDAIYIVSDLTADSTSPARITIQIENNILQLNWIGSGRVFQIERAANVSGPYEPLALTNQQFWREPVRSEGALFYRVIQW